MTLDGANVMDELAREVEKAMKGVFSSVQVKMTDINQVLNSIDTKSMSDKMASDNKKMEAAISKAVQATDKLGASVDSTGKKTKDASGKTNEGAAANKKLDDSAKSAASSTDKLGGAVTKAGGFLKGYGGIIAGVAGLGGIGTVLTKGLDRLTAIDNAKAKLSGLGHEAGAVQQIMDNAMASVKGTAYGLGDAASVAAGAVAAGVVPGKELERTLKVVGDAAAIAGTDLGTMGSIFNKVAASNKIQGDVIAQLSDAGIPVIQLLGKELGKTSEEVVKMASDGKINFETFQKAMEKGMGGAALKAGNTFKGAVDNAGAALGRLGATILDAPFKAAPGIIGGITEKIDGLNTKTKGVLEVLTTGTFGEAWAKAFPGKDLDNSGLGKFLMGINDGIHMVKAALDLLRTGDYTGTIGKALGAEEDSAIVDRLLSIREGFTNAADTVRLFVGTITGAGADVDLPWANQVIDLGSLVSDWFSRISGVFSDIKDAAIEASPAIMEIVTSLGTAVGSAGVTGFDLLVTSLELIAPVITEVIIPAIETLSGLMVENQGIVNGLVGGYLGFEAASTVFDTVSEGFDKVKGGAEEVQGWIQSGKDTYQTYLDATYGVAEAQDTLSGNLAVAAGAIRKKAAEEGVGLVTATRMIVVDKLSAAALAVKTTAVTVATGAWRGLNAVIRANPIMSIITAITLVVGALTWFFTQTELGKQVFETLKNAVVDAWEWIKGAFVTAWDFIQPILHTMWDFIANTLGAAFTFLYENIIKPVFNGIAATIAFVWDNLIQPYLKVWETVIFGILVPILMFLWNQAVKPVFEGIGNIIKSVWDKVISVVWGAMKIGIEALGAIFSWVWNSVIKPAWDGLGAGISWVWENVIRPAWDGLKAGLDAIGAAFSWVWNSVIKPAWDGLGAGIGWVVDNVIEPIWERFKRGLGNIGDFFGNVVNGIKDVWNGLRNILAKPVNFLIGTVYNGGIAKAWNKVAEFIPGLVKAPQMDLIPEYAVGGAIRGPGSGTSDDILAKLSNGEHVVTAEEVRRAGGQSALYTIRDMLFRGIPFKWDGGKVLATLGENNVSSYGAAVKSQGLGNVDPQGLFDQFMPRFATGGAVQGPQPVEPWMYQLLEGHKFAKAQAGRAYQWAGPRFVNDSFDCSGFMGSIAAAITGGNVWQRYWATGSFGRGQGAGGPQGFIPGTDNGFTIGVTDDPGGPGGGHTAGTLGAIPALGIHSPVNVESNGSDGTLYGGGPSPLSFLGQYHLPIGANGFFEAGSGSSGPSPDEQRSWLGQKVKDILSEITDPIANTIEGVVGAPPPEFLGIPRKFLESGVDLAADATDTIIGGLGDALSSVWTGAQNIGKSVLDFVNPFDSGGVASGVGFMPKNVIAPERVLSPEQTKMFEILVTALSDLSRGQFSPAVRQATGLEEDTPIVNAIITTQRALTDLIQGQFSADVRKLTGLEEGSPVVDAILTAAGNQKTQDQVLSAAVATVPAVINEQGEVLAEKIDKTTDAVEKADEDQRTEFAKLVDAWAIENIAGPLERAMTNAIGSDEARKLANGLVEGLGTTVDDALTEAGDTIVKGITDTITGTFEAFLTAGIDAAFGKNDGPFESWMMNAWAKMVDADIVARELLTATVKEIRGFRGDVNQNFAVTGELMADTSMYADRTSSSAAIANQVQIDAMNEMMRASIQFVLTKILFPALSALLTALITAGLTAVGAAIGGPIGAAIGGGIGAAIGGVLSGILGNAMGGVFDEGGLAQGVGMMPKATIQPERVLSPRQTSAFEKLVDVLDRGGLDRRSVHAPIYVQGATAPERIQDRIISGL